MSYISTPMSRWKLDDAAGPTAVESQHTINGTYTSIPTFGAGPIVRNGLLLPIFDGDAYVTIPDNAPYSRMAAVNTIECIFNFKPSGATTQPILGKWFSTGNQKSYRIGIDFATKKVQVDLSADGIATTSSSLSPTTNIIFGHTYYLTISKNGGNLSFYCNGVDLGTVTGVMVNPFVPFANTTESLYIGRWHQTAGEGGDLFCKGTISDVRIYTESSSIATHTIRYKTAFGDQYRNPNLLTSWV